MLMHFIGAQVSLINAWTYVALSATARLSRVLTVADMIAMARLLLVSLVTVGLLMAYPRTRRSLVATVHVVKRYAPKWAIPLIVAAQFCPGQIDDAVILPIVLLPILLNARKRTVFFRYVRIAWKG